MSIAEQIGVYVFATIMQLPFHLAIALPWLLAAWALAVLLRRRASPRFRFVSVSAIAAIGLAPVYGFHLSMIPIYTLVLSGDAEPISFAVSFLATWGLILLVGLATAWFNNRSHPSGANPSINTDASDKAACAGYVKRWASQ